MEIQILKKNKNSEQNTSSFTKRLSVQFLKETGHNSDELSISKHTDSRVAQRQIPNVLEADKSSNIKNSRLNSRKELVQLFSKKRLKQDSTNNSSEKNKSTSGSICVIEIDSDSNEEAPIIIRQHKKESNSKTQTANHPDFIYDAGLDEDFKSVEGVNIIKKSNNSEPKSCIKRLSVPSSKQFLEETDPNLDDPSTFSDELSNSEHTPGANVAQRPIPNVLKADMYSNIKNSRLNSRKELDQLFSKKRSKQDSTTNSSEKNKSSSDSICVIEIDSDSNKEAPILIRPHKKESNSKPQTANHPGFIYDAGLDEEIKTVEGVNIIKKSNNFEPKTSCIKQLSVSISKQFREEADHNLDDPSTFSNSEHTPGTNVAQRPIPNVLEADKSSNIKNSRLNSRKELDQLFSKKRSKQDSTSNSSEKNKSTSGSICVIDIDSDSNKEAPILIRQHKKESYSKPQTANHPGFIYDAGLDEEIKSVEDVNIIKKSNNFEPKTSCIKQLSVSISKQFREEADHNLDDPSTFSNSEHTPGANVAQRPFPNVLEADKSSNIKNSRLNSRKDLDQLFSKKRSKQDSTSNSSEKNKSTSGSICVIEIDSDSNEEAPIIIRQHKKESNSKTQTANHPGFIYDAGLDEDFKSVEGVNIIKKSNNFEPKTSCIKQLSVSISKQFREEADHNLDDPSTFSNSEHMPGTNVAQRPIPNVLEADKSSNIKNSPLNSRKELDQLFSKKRSKQDSTSNSSEKNKSTSGSICVIEMDSDSNEEAPFTMRQYKKKSNSKPQTANHRGFIYNEGLDEEIKSVGPELLKGRLNVNSPKCKNPNRNKSNVNDKQVTPLHIKKRKKWDYESNDSDCIILDDKIDLAEHLKDPTKQLIITIGTR